MANYTIAAGDNGIAPFTIVAAQVDTVTFTDNITQAEIISDGAAEVWYTTDGSTPSVPAAGTSTRSFRLPAGAVSVDRRAMFGSSDTIKFIGGAGAKVSVQRHDL